MSVASQSAQGRGQFSDAELDLSALGTTLWRKRWKILRPTILVGLLTLITVITTPLMMIGTWYGMNFKDMPELEYKHAYPIAGICMVVDIVRAGDECRPRQEHRPRWVWLGLIRRAGLLVCLSWGTRCGEPLYGGEVRPPACMAKISASAAQL